jgi:hypothetical protein
MRKDEPRALIEAARQYMTRQDAVEKQYQSLVTMGLSVDKDLFFKSISLPKDDFLDAISHVVPLVTSMDSKFEILGNQLADARAKMKDYAEVKSNYERLQKRWNERVAAQLNDEAARNRAAIASGRSQA